jgi:hypothetical protein
MSVRCVIFNLPPFLYECAVTEQALELLNIASAPLQGECTRFKFF